MKTSQITLCLKYASTPSKTPLISITSESLSYSRLVGSNDRKVIIPDVRIGVHDLTLRLINKQSQDTVIDIDGHIVQDLYAVIESLKVDQHDVIHKIDHLSRYHDNDGQAISTNGWLTFSSAFHILLQAPGWYFVRNLSILPDTQLRTYLTGANHCPIITAA